MSAERIAIYPGSFDPLTLGHVDIIQRGSELFDKIVVAVLRNVDKSPLFTVEERLAMIEEAFAETGNVVAESFSGLLVDYAKSRHASTIVRGIRAISDFEYEFQMALMNRRLAPDIETVFMMPAEEYSYVSSRLVKEVASLGGNITGLVPARVETRLQEKVGSKGPQPERRPPPKASARLAEDRKSEGGRASEASPGALREGPDDRNRS